MKTFFDEVERVGQRAIARELKLKQSKVRRCAHGLVRINDGLLDACAKAWPDFDRASTVLEWDRRRQEHLKRARDETVRTEDAHDEAAHGERAGVADAS